MESCGNNRATVDRILWGSGALIDLFIPAVIKSVYLYGSQAGGEVHPASDIDLMIVLHTAATADTIERLANTIRACNALSPIPIDAIIVDEADMVDFGAALLSEESFLLMETDMRPTLSYPAPDFLAATLMHMAFTMVDSYYPNRGPLTKPLAPAQPNDPWLGFGQNGSRSLDGRPIPNVKKLVTLITRIVQGLLASRTGRMIHPKDEVLAVAFRKHLQGTWADYVETVFRRYRHEWRQSIPTDDNGRRELRQLCEDAYRFAEWFLGLYREFLVADLRHPDEARRRLARRNIVRLPFPAELA